MAASSRPTEATIARCLEAGSQGFSIGNRLSVPFRADLISILVGKRQSMLSEPDLITDFSPNDKSITVVEYEDRMDLYFHDYPSLQKELGRWQGMLIITCCELCDDLFDLSKHVRLSCTLRDDDNRVKIERDGRRK